MFSSIDIDARHAGDFISSIQRTVFRGIQWFVFKDGIPKRKAARASSNKVALPTGRTVVVRFHKHPAVLDWMVKTHFPPRWSH